MDDIITIIKKFISSLSPDKIREWDNKIMSTLTDIIRSIADFIINMLKSLQPITLACMKINQTEK